MATTPSRTTPLPAGAAGLRWTGWILSAPLVLFLLFDAVGKITHALAPGMGSAQLGVPASALHPLGIVLLLSTLLYVWPRAAALGAILLTGYLGGAVCTLVRFHSLASTIAFPVLLGVLIWMALLLRDRRLRAVLPGNFA